MGSMETPASPRDRAQSFLAAFIAAPNDADIEIRTGHSEAGQPAVFISIDGKMYVAGGRFGLGFDSELTDILEIYDPATNAWTTGPPMPSGVRSGMASIVVNNCLYAIGGEWDRSMPSGVFPQNEAYDAARESWRVLEPMVTPVHGLTGAALANGRILIPGGSLTNGVSEVSTKLQTFRADLDCR